MPKVKVWNDNVHPYKEKFHDETISIPAKGYVEMDEDEAQMFKGSYSPPKYDADGNDLPEGYKMIRIEKMGSVEAVPEPKEPDFTCAACKYKASSQTDLDEHAKANHKDRMVVDEEAEAELKKRKKKAS